MVTSGPASGEGPGQGLFHVVDLDDPGAVRAAGRALSGGATDVLTRMQAAQSAFQQITAQWQAAETPLLQSAFISPVTTARELSSAGQLMQVALSNYAASLEDLRTERTRLLNDIREFETTGVAGAEDTDWAAREERITELQQRCRNLAAAKDEAQNTCAQSLAGITTSASQTRSSPEGAREADVAEETHEDYTFHDSGWAAATVGLGVASSVQSWVSRAHTVAGPLLGASRTMARQGWMPGLVQKFANANSTSSGLVNRLTGWDASKVTNAGQWMSRADPGNPFALAASPTLANLGKNLRPKDVLRRTLANLNPKNKVPSPGMKGWSTAGKWIGRAGSVLTAATSFVGSWNEDSAKHPSMHGAEKGARAAVDAAATTAGAWAGAKGGAAVGAAIGTALGPAGTVVGGIVGGVIGGMAGGAVGDKVGDLAKGAVSSITDGVKSLFGG
ncbi:hypothetical protein GCM10009771_26150 [Nesterenkonia flava]